MADILAFMATWLLFLLILFLMTFLTVWAFVAMPLIFTPYAVLDWWEDI